MVFCGLEKKTVSRIICKSKMFVLLKPSRAVEVPLSLEGFNGRVEVVLRGRD